MVAKLRLYIKNRNHEGNYRRRDIFSTGIHKSYKTQSAHALISLLNGVPFSRLNNPSDACYNELRAALSVSGCFGDKRLLSAIRSTPWHTCQHPASQWGYLH